MKGNNCKYIVVALMLALGIQSCNKEHVVCEEEQTPILFNHIATRAVESASDIDEFRVWSSVATTADGPATAQLTNERVWRDGSAWDYTNTRFWFSNHHFYFLGLYAHQGGARHDLAFTEGSYGDEGGPRYIGYSISVQTPVTADLDILTAFNHTDTNNDYNRTVSMNFGHIMSKVNLIIKKNKVTNESDIFVLDEVRISGIKDKASYFCFPLAHDTFMGWSEIDDNSTLEFYREFDGREIGFADSESVKFSDHGLLLIPQPIELENVMISINFRYGFEGNDDVSTYTRKEVVVYLPVAPDLWQPGKSINYTLSLSTVDPIVFDTPSVTPWGGMQSGGTIIIK